MKKKRLGYFEYDPVIYPRKIWVHIGTDFKELAPKVFDDIEFGDKEYYGVVYGEVARKTDGMLGILASFPYVKDMTMKVCSHEASHICDAI